jgi:hypothetical protein
VLTALFCSLGYHLSLPRHTTSSTSLSESLCSILALDDGVTSAACSPSAAANRIVVSVKTGGTEAPLKIPTQMQTTLRCVENILLFSDLEQDIGEYHLRDAL